MNQHNSPMPFREREMVVQAAFPLHGTLTLPVSVESGQRVPAILIIPGTGKSDRDGNGGGIDLNLYRDLAHFLAGLGYASLRYDKRGTHASGGDFDEAGLWDQVEDAKACLQFLQNVEQIDANRLLVLGHSEGCILAPAVYVRQPISGLILLAGVAGSMKEEFPVQGEQAIQELEALGGFKGWLIRLLNVPARARKQSADIFAKIFSSPTPVIRIKGKKFNAKWFQEHIAYDVRDDLPKVACPTLAITGSNDLQVKPEHARVLAETVQGPAEWHIIPEMNHILRRYEQPHTMLGLMKEYKTLLQQPIDERLLMLLADWLGRHFPLDRDN